MDIDLDAIRQRDRQFGRLAYATQGDHDRRALLAEVDRLRAQLADIAALKSHPVTWEATGIKGRAVSDVHLAMLGIVVRQ